MVWQKSKATKSTSRFSNMKWKLWLSKVILGLLEKSGPGGRQEGRSSPRPGTYCRGSINPVRLITTLKLRRKQLGDSFIRSLHFIITEEYIMAQTQKQRMALIRKVSKKFNKKLITSNVTFDSRNSRKK